MGGEDGPSGEVSRLATTEAAVERPRADAAEARVVELTEWTA